MPANALLILPLRRAGHGADDQVEAAIGRSADPGPQTSVQPGVGGTRVERGAQPGRGWSCQSAEPSVNRLTSIPDVHTEAPRE
jgi:hypothetical protein